VAMTSNPDAASAHGQPPVTFTIDGIEYTSAERRMTAAAVLRLAGLDPADYDLLRVVGQGGHEQRFHDQDEVELVPGGRYVSLFTGPTPVE
jgi:putative intracellular protease/amidase